MIAHEGSAFIDFERFLVRVFNSVKDGLWNFRNVTFRRDDEPHHREDLSVVVSLQLESGVEFTSFSPDNFINTYSSRFSFYRAAGFPGHIAKRTAVYDASELPFGEMLWIAEYEDGTLSLTKLSIIEESVVVAPGKNYIPKPEDYYPESAQLWFRGAKEVADLLGEDDNSIIFDSDHVASVDYSFRYLRNDGVTTHEFERSKIYHDIVLPGTMLESSELLEDGDRVLFRLSKNEDPVYEMYGGLIEGAVRLSVDPLNEVQSKRVLGNLLGLVLMAQRELAPFDVPVNKIRCASSFDEADVSRDRARKPYLEFQTQFQYEAFVPIQRYLRDIRIVSMEVLERPLTTLFLRGDSL